MNTGYSVRFAELGPQLKVNKYCRQTNHVAFF